MRHDHRRGVLLQRGNNEGSAGRHFAVLEFEVQELRTIVDK